MTQVKVFISYSHRDAAEKESLLSHLRVLERGGTLQSIDAWDDSRIGLGEDWREKINDALNEAQIAILLVTDKFLTSDFILQEEVRVILERHKSDLIIIPVIARHCAWQAVEWLSHLNIFNSGKPVWDGEGGGVDKALSDIALEVAGYAKRIAGARPQVADAGPAPAAPAETTYAHILFVTAAPEGEEKETWLSALPLVGRWFRPKPKPPQTQQLLVLVRAGLSELPGEQARRYVCRASGGGVVVATFEDPQALLRFALSAAPKLRGSGLPSLRMGLHSAAVGPHASNDSSGVPVRGIETARRLTGLGHDGHIVASQEAAGFLRGAADADYQFDLAPRRELTPGAASDVFNVHDSRAGNPQPLKAKAPERVIREIKIPKKMRAVREEKLRIVFCPEVPYVKVRFEFEGNKKPVRVSCGKPEVEDCTFEYDFENQGESREQTFKLVAENPKQDALVTVRVLCRDEYGQLIAAAERPVFLCRRPPPPQDYKQVVAFFLWVWDRFRRLPVAAQLLAPLLVAVVAVTVVYLRLPTCRQEELKVKLRLWPKPYIGAWEDNFYGEESKTLRDRWSFADGQVEDVLGEGDASDRALWLKTPGPFLVDVGKLGPKRFYDFNINFKAKFREGDKVAWLLRASPDGQSGYLFVLERNGTTLVLNGSKLLGPNNSKRFDSRSRDVPIESCCHPDDTFDIHVEARGYRFNVAVGVENINTDSPGAIRNGVNKGPLPLAGFEDEDELFRYGTVGPLVRPGTSSVVEYWEMADAPLCSAADATNDRPSGVADAANPADSGTR